MHSALRWKSREPPLVISPRGRIFGFVGESQSIGLTGSSIDASILWPLWLTLPGIDPIDPVKTGHTAMWLAMLFCSVPLIDARDPNLITTAAQARAAERFLR